MDEQDIIDYATKFIGTPYIWGGNSPKGFDCSGFVIYILQHFDLFPENQDTNAAGIFQYFKSKGKEITEPIPGCLIFFGNKLGNKISHVEFCIDSTTTIGASGGDSTVTTIEIANTKKARVKIGKVQRGRKILGYIDPK